MDYQVRLGEQNGILHGFCPYCSMMYPIEEAGEAPRAAIELPSKCKRCGAPMNIKGAKLYADKLAGDKVLVEA